MKTFSETKNKKPFDWNAFLIQKEITDKEWKKAKRLAQSWVTCACGNQCSIIPRDNNYIPKDTKLALLGSSFYKKILNEDVKEAKKILKILETRSIILINQEIDYAKKIIDEYNN